MSKYELEHAIRYATECTKSYLFEEYLRRYPHLFNYANIKIRPADSDKDYYVPELLKDSCFVVVETNFEKPACIQLGCFPIRNIDLETCSGAYDEPMWVPLGSKHTLACQPACSDIRFRYKMDTEWLADKCVEVNPYKKMFAMNPEMLMDLRTRKKHGGLEWHDGRLYLTAEYCHAYGLDFNNNDCFNSQGQSVGEFFLGKTLYRTIRNQIEDIKELQREPPPIVASGDTLRQALFNQYIFDEKQNDTTNIPIVQLDDDAIKLANMIIKEISIDLGVDLSLDYVQHILKKKIPKLLNKALRDVVIKSAVKQFVIRSTTQLAIRLSTMAASSLGGINHVLFIIGIISMVLDVMDPNDYNKVLDAARLERIDRKLDAKYFGHAADYIRVVTPEYVWDNVLDDDDESSRYEYMSNKIKEYLEALRKTTKPVDLKPAPPLFQRESKNLNYLPWIIYIIVSILLACMLVFDRYISMWALATLIAVTVTRQV